jgi:CRISPR-associated protein Csy2
MSRRHFIGLSRLKIHHANALSSPFTIGFPAMTAWLGAVHALERKLRQFPDYQNIQFTGVVVSCHDHNLQTYKGPGDYVHSIIGTGNPLDKDGSRPSFIEEARCHLDVSLLLECPTLPEETNNLCHKMEALIHTMKIASGDVLSLRRVISFSIDEEKDEAPYKPILRYLMPGYVLLERRDLMKQSMEEGLDAIDALLEHLQVNFQSETQENTNPPQNGKVNWTRSRKKHGPDQNYTGWLVPIAVGFHGISDLGLAKNQRDPETPHRFAESLVTLGEFVMPSQLGKPHGGLGKNLTLEDIVWRYRSYQTEEPNMYVCTTGV